MTPKKIIDKYLGISHKHLGRTFEGLDCWGLIKMIYADIGVEVRDLATYDKLWAQEGKNHFVENYYEDWEWHTAPLLLDVLLYRNSKGIPAHAGVYLEKNRFIHSVRCKGVVLGTFTQWNEKLEGIYRNKKIKRDNDGFII